MNVNYLIILIIPLISLGQINWIVFDSENSLLPYNQINDLHIDLDNNLLIGSEYGAAKLNTNLEWEVYYNEGESSGLSGNIIKYINTDLNNIFWQQFTPSNLCNYIKDIVEMNIRNILISNN